MFNFVSFLCRPTATVLFAGYDGDVIVMPELPNVVPEALRTSIFVRESYKVALNAIKDLVPGNSIVLTGTPGNGKSAFMLMILCYLARHRQSVAIWTMKSDVGQIDIRLNFTDPRDVQVDYGSERAGSLTRMPSESHRMSRGARGPSRQCYMI